MSKRRKPERNRAMRRKPKLCRKESFPTALLAAMRIQVIQVSESRSGKVDPRGKMRVYFCKQCKAWHIGHTDRYSRKSKGSKMRRKLTDADEARILEMLKAGRSERSI